MSRACLGHLTRLASALTVDSGGRRLAPMKRDAGERRCFRSGRCDERALRRIAALALVTWGRARRLRRAAARAPLAGQQSVVGADGMDVAGPRPGGQPPSSVIVCRDAMLPVLDRVAGRGGGLRTGRLAWLVGLRGWVACRSCHGWPPGPSWGTGGKGPRGLGVAFRLACSRQGGPMRTPKFAAAAAVLFVVLMGAGAAMAKPAPATPASAKPATGTLVTVGSPRSPFSQNKQNEPAVAIDAHDPSMG